MKSLSPHCRSKKDHGALLQPFNRSNRFFNGSNSGLIWYAVVLICAASLSSHDFAQTVPPPALPAAELLRKIVDAELKAQDSDHSRWMYEVKTGPPQKDEVKWVIETRDGDLDRLRSLNGKPITGDQEKQEEQRITNLLHHPEMRKKRRRAKEEDAQQTARLFKMIPSAVTARYGARQGNLVEILFEPNPNFHPSSREAVVFHEMAGQIWIDPKADRLAQIDGHLIREVKFGGGLLGYLDKGGEFHVRQSEVARGHWEVTLLRVNMRGKALFFKTISVQQNEERSNFRQVPETMTLTQAAEELHRQCSSQSAGNHHETQLEKTTDVADGYSANF